jgi:hypothetical protein
MLLLGLHDTVDDDWVGSGAAVDSVLQAKRFKPFNEGFPIVTVGRVYLLP